MTNKDKILDLIKNKALSAGDVSMWNRFLETLPDDLANDIHSYLILEDNALSIVTNNRR